MTSTNDGKDVKSNQTCAKKGKTYYIELYKTLDSRLSTECGLSERTQHLCDAWRRVHSLCQHSASATHTHLLNWLQRHTAKTILQTEWQSPKSKEQHSSLIAAINDFTEESKAAVARRNGQSPQWETQLVQRGEWFKRVLSNPWGHPVLKALLNPKESTTSDNEILEWLKEERGAMFVTRLRQLAASKCDDLATCLVSAVMDRARPHYQPEEPEDTPTQSITEPTFATILRSEAGFTVDVWELLTDIEFVLLHKSDKVSRCIELAKQTPLRNGYQLVERLQSRLEASPKEKKLWKNAKEVATLVAQVIIARCMVVPVCAGVCRTALYCCTRSLVRLLRRARLPAATATLAAPAATARHLHTLAAGVHAQCPVDMKPFVCELYVRAITAGMNELERLKLKTEKAGEARAAAQTLATWFTQLGALVAASERLHCECVLTAFSLHPAAALYDRVRAAPPLPALSAQDVQDKKEETNSEFGSWATDSRTQTNLVKTSETLNMKHTQNRANVLSTAIFNEGERIGLSAELCQDLAVLLSGPRVKTLSWDMDRELLLENCRVYIERTGGGTRAICTELKFLNLDPSSYLHLPEEDDHEDDLYYGIEKGYEHLVEIEEPEDIWQNTMFDDLHNESTETCSIDSDMIGEYKKNRKSFHLSDEECDPLSIESDHTKSEKKKERPHSKERSSKDENITKEKKKEKKERKKKSAAESVENKECSRERRKEGDELIQESVTSVDKKDKKERKPRKKKIEDPHLHKSVECKPGSLSSLIGLRVAKVNIPEEKHTKNTAQAPCISSDIDSQGKPSLAPLNSIRNDPDVLFDGLFCMDEYKSPNKQDPLSLEITKNVDNKVYLGKSLAGKPPQPINKHTVDRSKGQNTHKNFQPSMPCQTVTEFSTPNKHEAPHNELVKNSISKLLDFRRQKSHQSPRLTMSPPPPSANAYTHKMSTSSDFQNNYEHYPSQTSCSVLPQTDEISDIPKIYINNKQINQLKEIRDEVDTYLKNKFSPKSSIVQYTSKQNVDPITDKVNNAQKLVSNETMKSTTPAILKHSKETVTQSHKNFQDFLRDLHQTLNAGADTTQKSKVSQKNTKKEIKPMNKVQPLIPNIIKHSNSRGAKSTLQTKKSNNQLNTFSRLSYMHKSKQMIEALINSQKQVKKHQNNDQNLTKLKYLHEKGDVVISRTPIAKEANKEIHKTKPFKRPQNIKHVKNSIHSRASAEHFNTDRNIESTIKKSSPTQLSENDQNDLRLLLRQQNILNSRPVTLENNTGTCNLNVAVDDPQHAKPLNLSSKMSNKRNSGIPFSESIPKKIPIHGEIYKNKNKNNYEGSNIKKVNEGPHNSSSKVTDTKIIKVNQTKTKKGSKKSNTLKITENSQNEKQDWKEVMDAILSHKTPSRGPNALDVAVGKESILRSMRISRPKSINEGNRKISNSKKHSTNAPLISAVDTPTKCSDSSNLPTVSNNAGHSEHKLQPVISSTINQAQAIEDEFKKTLNTCYQNDTTLLFQPQQHLQHDIEKTSQPELKQQEKNSSNNTQMDIEQELSDIESTLNKDVSESLAMKAKLNRVNQANKEVVSKRNYTSLFEKDSLTTGIPNADYDYDLIEELMDDDLRQEIGELMSDDEAYSHLSSLITKEINNKNNNVASHVFSQQQNVQATSGIQSSNQTTVRQNVHTVIEHLLKPKTSTVASSNDYKLNPGEILNNPTSVIPVQGAIKADMTSCINAEQHSEKSNQINLLESRNLMIASVPQPAVQNVVLIGSDLVFDPYSSMQPQLQTTPYLSFNNNTPNISLYETTQFAAPTVNPVIIGNALTASEETDLSKTSISTPAPNNSTLLNDQISCNTTSEVNQDPKSIFDTELNSILDQVLKQPFHIGKDKQNDDIDLSHKLNQEEDFIPNDSKSVLDINIYKNSERRVLSEVQEKQKIVDNNKTNNSKTQPYDNKNESQKEPECLRVESNIIKDSTPVLINNKEEEHLNNKRMSLINRKMNHQSDDPPIPLTYSPLIDKNPPKISLPKEIDKADLDRNDKYQDNTKNNLSKSPIAKSCNDNSKENDNYSTRRLRSSIGRAHIVSTETPQNSNITKTKLKAKETPIIEINEDTMAENVIYNQEVLDIDNLITLKQNNENKETRMCTTEKKKSKIIKSSNMDVNENTDVIVVDEHDKIIPNMKNTSLPEDKILIYDSGDDSNNAVVDTGTSISAKPVDPAPVNDLIEIEQNSTSIQNESPRTQVSQSSANINSSSQNTGDNPDKKVVRIKLPNGKIFKASVYGKMHVSLESLFTDQSMKHALINNLTDKKKYTFNVKQISPAGKESIKIIESRDEQIKLVQKPPFETVSLLSDDEEADDTHSLRTEFGSFKIASMDQSVFNKHQRKLEQKCYVQMDITENSSKEKRVPDNNKPHVQLQPSSRPALPNKILNKSKPFNTFDITISQKPLSTTSQDIIEIDDSSNDSVIDSQKSCKDLSESFLSADQIESLEIDELKSSILKDLETDEAANEISKPEEIHCLEASDDKMKEIQDLLFNFIDDDMVSNSNSLNEPNSHNSDEVSTNQSVAAVKECSINLTRCDSLVKKYEQQKILNHKCLVELTRCDEEVDLLSSITSNYNCTESNSDDLIGIDDDMFGYNSSSNLSRSGSFSLLNDFPDFTYLTFNHNPSGLINNEASPVTEMFESVPALTILARDTINESVPDEYTCYNEWFQTKNDLKTQIQSNINLDMQDQMKEHRCMKNMTGDVPTLKLLTLNILKEDLIFDRYVVMQKSSKCSILKTDKAPSSSHRLKRKSDKSAYEKVASKIKIKADIHYPVLKYGENDSTDKVNVNRGLKATSPSFNHRNKFESAVVKDAMYNVPKIDGKFKNIYQATTTKVCQSLEIVNNTIALSRNSKDTIMKINEDEESYTPRKEKQHSTKIEFDLSINTEDSKSCEKCLEPDKNIECRINETNSLPAKINCLPTNATYFEYKDSNKNGTVKTFEHSESDVAKIYNQQKIEDHLEMPDKFAESVPNDLTDNDVRNKSHSNVSEFHLIEKFHNTIKASKNDLDITNPSQKNNNNKHEVSSNDLNTVISNSDSEQNLERRASINEKFYEDQMALDKAESNIVINEILQTCVQLSSDTEIRYRISSVNNNENPQTPLQEKVVENIVESDVLNAKDLMKNLTSIEHGYGLNRDGIQKQKAEEKASKRKEVSLAFKNHSNVVLKGVEFKDPVVGTCYVFPFKDITENYKAIDEKMPITEGEAVIRKSESECCPTDDCVLEVTIPENTYSRYDEKEMQLKRKRDMSDIKTIGKKYRKGKQIDYLRLTNIGLPTYSKEFKRVFDYIGSLKFSVSRSFNRDSIDVEGLIKNWPIKSNICISVNDEIDNNSLFSENTEIVATNPLDMSYVEEINVTCESEEQSSDAEDNNFNMGFGERSDRVIQNLKNTGDVSIFSAAILSDVKQPQPFFLSEGDETYNNEMNLMYVCKDDQVLKLNRCMEYIQLRDKVRSYFKKSTSELYYKSMKQKDKYNVFDDESTCDIPYDFSLTELMKPLPTEVVVQVVQVGQLPVSAAAQNPVSCDPRVTQVSNASPSQCVESSPQDDTQVVIKTEYTELTTADLSIPLQEYHDQNLPHESQNPTNTLDEENTQIETDVKSIIKIEFTEETPEINENCETTEAVKPKTEANELEKQYDASNAADPIKSTLETDQTDFSPFFNLPNENQTVTETFEQHQKQHNGPTEKFDQIAHAMSAAGITPESISNCETHALVDIISETLHQKNEEGAQSAPNTYSNTTAINALALQQALAQILPPPLNETSNSDNQQNCNSQVLHIVQSNNAGESQITLVDNSQQSVINTPNATPVLHIVQNKPVASAANGNGTSPSQTNSFNGLSLVDTGLQQGGNQLLHIVNAGSQKTSNSTGQLLKRVNLLTNLANVQGSNDQKMVQFLCKSADGKSIQLNAPHQRSMVLRLQPIEAPNINVQANGSKLAENQDLTANLNVSNPLPSNELSPQEIKSRSIYEDNYAKFVHNSSPKTTISEKSTSLPKFNQAFGKPVFQEGTEKSNESSPNSHVNNNSENDCQTSDNSVNLDHIRQIGSPPLLLRKSPGHTSQTQSNLVQQLKQTIGPMNIQTMHGGVIYTRQIPVNIGGGQTINLITMPSTELIDDSNQKQPVGNQGEMEHSIIKIVPQNQTSANSDMTSEDGNGNGSSESAQNHQPVLTQMRIKLPMLSKAPQMVSGTRVVRPSFFQIQRNVIGGANQPVYQQLVLTAAPPLGQQTIRLPQTQTRQHRTPENPTSTESQMSSSTLEQLREFDMVLEQVKERSTVQPNSCTSSFQKLHTSSCDTTDTSVSASSSISTDTHQQVLYSIGNSQPLSVAYVNRKATAPTPTTSTFVRSPDSSGIVDSQSSSSHVRIPHTVTSESTASSQNEPQPTQSKPAKSSSKSKSRNKASSNPPNSLKLNSVPTKTSSQKPLEDEQTTQRILYILAEYKEQVENSPDKDKPAPRRRTNPPLNPCGSSKRKKSSSGCRRTGRDKSPIQGEDNCRTMGSEDSSGTSQCDCNESYLECHSPQDSPRKVVRKLTFEHETYATQPRPQPQRNVIVADGQTITVARGTSGKPTTAVLMPANYILPVSMVKGGQQIAIVTNRGPKLLTVGSSEGGTTNALLLQRLIGPAGLKPVLARPGVRHIRLPTAALHNLQAFNLAAATTVQPPDSTASPAPAPTPPELVETRATSSPWTEREAQELRPDRGASPDGSEVWHLPSSSDPQEYGYEETVRSENLERTVLDSIPDRYSPDMEAQRIFDKMFDVDPKKAYLGDTHDDSPRCTYDIDASDCDDKIYHQVVQKKDLSSQRQHRLTHLSTTALRHKYAILEHELRLQKSLSEECEDLGVDSPSAAELFPEAELLFSASPAPEHSQDHGHHSNTPQPTIISQCAIPQPDMDDQIATDRLLAATDVVDGQALELGLEDVGIVTVSGDGLQTTVALNHEEFARAHPNTTFHSEPTEEGEVQPITIAGLKGRHITSTIFQSNRTPATVLMAAPPGSSQQKYNIENMIDNIPQNNVTNINLASVLVKDDGLTRFDSILTDSRELHLSNTASAIIHSTGNATQVIRRVCYEDDKRERFLMDEPEAIIAGDDAKMVAEDSSRDATMDTMAEEDDRSSPERHAELFWESNSASERSESRRPLDYSSDSEKCCKSPSYDETNSTDSSLVGTHMRLDSVIKEARGLDRSGSGDNSSADDNHPPLRTYPPKRLYHLDVERSLSGKTRAVQLPEMMDGHPDRRVLSGASPDSLGQRRASVRGVVKRGCPCCNGSPPRTKKPRQRKPTMDFATQ